MNLYEKLSSEAQANGLEVIELPLEHSDGMVCGNLIGIREGQTSAEKACVLAEELAHARYTVGNILDQNDVSNQKQEHLARVATYDRMIGLARLVEAFRHGCRNQYEMAEYLDVTEKFLRDALECYREKYGTATTCDGFTIRFEPCLSVSIMMK